MVSQKAIEAHLKSYKSTAQSPTAVVVGGTNGIGRGFLDELATNTARPTIFVVGRSSASLANIIADLKTLNPQGTYHGIAAGDLTLIRSVDTAVEQIQAYKPHAIDILYLSPGFLDFSGKRTPTAEGLDAVTSIRVHARLRFTTRLLPLLRQASHPRVISVLAGSQEGKIDTEDLSLLDPKHYSVIAAANASATYTTLSFEHLAVENPAVSFIHISPGLVRTNLLNTEYVNPIVRTLLNWVLLPLFGPFFFYTPRQSGQRMLFAATNDRLAAPGAFSLNDKNEVAGKEAVLQPLREQGMAAKIFKHLEAETEAAVNSS